LRNELGIQQTEDLIRKMSSMKMVNHTAPAEVDFEEQEFIQENALPMPQKNNGYLPENTPLVTRTRFILMSNPHVERKSQLVSS
jgi:hypothetical protein